MKHVEALKWIFDAWLYSDSLFLRNEEEGNDYRPVNDCGYFMLLFAQLEDAINSTYEAYVGSWERVPFIHRLNMLELEIDSKDQELIQDHYEIRCDIAHGRLLKSKAIHMPAIVEKYLKLMTVLD